MFYLPRICEHCLNPSCMASCPSGAIYKRVEDGIVLVDQDRCRGWRQCITGCPYKKIYFNHKTGKAEKCTFCYPRIEVGLPTVCSETCVGRLRYLGLFLYDADAGHRRPPSMPDEKDLYEAQLDLMLDPNDPEVHRRRARREGIPDDWMDAARRSPVYALAKKYRVALPLHPEYRTMPMVWYVPPLSPGRGPAPRPGPRRRGPRQPVRRHRRAAHPGGVPRRAVHRRGHRAWSPRCCSKLAAMRSFMRGITLGRRRRRVDPRGRGHDRRQSMYEMYRLMAIAKYEERYVIPKAHVEQAHDLEEMGCSLDFDGGPGMQDSGPFGEASGRPVPVAVETFNALKQPADLRGHRADGVALRGRVNLLNWDGNGAPAGLFPGRRTT